MAKDLRNHTQVSLRSGVVVPNLQASASVARFDKFVANIDRSIQDTSPELQLILCALAFESILRPSELLSFLHGCEAPILAGTKVLVAWSDHKNEVHRRVLSARTQIALSRLADSKTNWDLKLSELKQFLVRKYPDSNRFRSTELIQIVCGDALAWNYHLLPKLCLGYLTGELSGKLLPSQRLERLLQHQEASSTGSDAFLSMDNDSFDSARAVYLERFFDTTEPTFSAANLVSLQSIFSDQDAGSSIRVSEFRQRGQLIERVNAAASAISKTGSAVDAFLLGWVIFLLNEGSVRLSNPTVTTICAYFRIAPSISRAFSTLRLRPIELSQEQWEEFFTDQKQQSSGPALTALQSFHEFVVSQLGVDPVSHMYAANNSAANIRASFVTESEFFQCLQLADSISLDERICSSVKAMLAIGYSVPIRINEVKGMHLCDIKVYPGLAEIHYSPTRSEATGKSVAARRTMKVSDPTLIKHLSGWLERRRKDLALDHDPLFGDPHSSDLYRFGHCVHFTNRILKRVCNDPEASFHDFRHAWATRNILDLTDPEEHLPRLTIDELRVQIGHAPQSNTIIESYFHCHDLILRRSVDAYVHKFETTGPAAAFWLGKKSDALRAGKSRSSKPDRYYRDQIQIAAKVIWQRQLLPVPAKVAQENSSNEPGLQTVRKFLADVHTGLNSDAVSSRCGLDQAGLMRLTLKTLRSVSLLCNTYSHHEPVKGDDPREIDLQLQKLKAELSKLNVYLGLQVEPALRAVYENLLIGKHEHADYKKAVTGWARILKGKYWSLENASTALPAIKLLVTRGMDTTCLEIRYACDDPTDAYSVSSAFDSPTVKAAVLQVKAIAPFMATPLPVRHKQGRPSVYLVFRRNSKQPTSGGLTDSARCRYGRINGLMFSLLVMQALN